MINEWIPVENIIICQLDNALHELKRKDGRANFDYLDGIFDMHDKAYEIVKEVFKNGVEAQSKEKANGWTRIEKGEFPPENQFVFIMLHNGNIVQAQLDGEKWRFGEIFSVGKNAIVAWMPIPKLEGWKDVSD